MLWFLWTLQVLLQRWCLTCYCVHTLTTRGNRERPESGIYNEIFEKTQYLMNTLYLPGEHVVDIWRIYVRHMSDHEFCEDILLRRWTTRLRTDILNYLQATEFQDSCCRLFLTVITEKNYKNNIFRIHWRSRECKNCIYSS